MSATQVSSGAPINESNITLPKRIQTGPKKSKVYSQAPELQRYIETIIKASNEFDDGTSAPIKDKYQKEKKLGRYSASNCPDNQTRNEKAKLDTNADKRKNVNKSNASVPEPENFDEAIPSALAAGFEDPRNWKFKKIKTSSFSLKVENFLKELYPNPYHLENLNEFYDSKNSQNEVSGGATTSVTTSVVNVGTQVNAESKNSVPPVAEDNPSNKETQNPPPDKSSEKFTEPTQSEISTTTQDLDPSELKLEQVKQFRRNEIHDYASNTSSSVESVTSAAESLHILRKRTNLKANRKRNSEEMLEGTESKPSTVIAFGEKRTDSDIGKLNLLSTTDSNAFQSKKMKHNIKNKGLNSDIFKQEELNDLRKIQEVMNKADESFLLICEKSRHKRPKVSKNTVGDKNLRDIWEGLTRKLRDDLRRALKEERENCSQIKRETTEQINPKAELEGVSKSTVGVSQLPKEGHHCNFKSEPELSKVLKIETSALNYSKTDTDSSQSLNIIEQQTTKEFKREDADASQKIDEVLEFIYDCLMKFNKSEEVIPDEECNASTTKKIFSTNQMQATTSKLSNESDGLLPGVTSQTPKSTCSRMFGEANRARIRTRCRRSEFVLQPENKQCQVSLPVENTDGQPALYVNSEVNSEIYMPTAEIQNELGGYTEMMRDDPSSNEGLRLTKSVFPLPGKLNKSKTDARSIREVLETEEKLYAKEFCQKEPNECVRPKELITCKVADEWRIMETSNSYSITSGFKCPSSNFVICVNSLPQNLKTFKAVTPVIAMPQCPPVPLINEKDDLETKLMMSSSDTFLKEYYPPCAIQQHVLACTYSFRQGSLFYMNTLSVKYTAMRVCEKAVSNISELEESSFKNSECFINITTKSVNKLPETNKPSTCSIPALNKPELKVPDEKEVNFESECEQNVVALIEAIEQAEGKVLILQELNKVTRNLNKNPNLGNDASKSTESESLENDLEDPKIDKTKVYDLLVRTYNLQLKLQECLNKITTLQPNAQPITLKDQESAVDFKIYVHNKASQSDASMSEANEQQKNSVPIVEWPADSEDTSKPNEEALVQMVDHSTSYNPPAEDQNNKNREESPEAPPERTEKAFPHDDDDSSVCSFKSSNDFSEGSDTCNVKNELQPVESLNKKDLYKKIYEEIDLVKQIFELESRQKEQEKNVTPNSNLRDSQEQVQNSLTQYDAKTPAKILKTVFKGRESSTELTIGLKDIPMTQVKNISVEKTKMSPNHTKISVCISKDKGKELRTSDGNSEVFHNKFPAYYPGHFAPSLRGVPSGEEDDTSKSSQSPNEDSDGEEDYKSVGSTVEDSITDTEQVSDKCVPEEQKAVKTSPPKKVPKHKFDFYRKPKFEETDVKPRKVVNSMCRYKELEPLNRAMTEMQIRMRSIKRDALFTGNDYYERALKLAKMSAGYCQSCGHRAVIPNDTFGYYKTLIPRRSANHNFSQLKTPVSPESSFYSFRSNNADVGEHFCDLDIKHSSYLLNPRTHSNRTVLRGSLQDMPVLLERV